MLNTNKRIRLKGFRSESVRRTSQGFGVEDCLVSLKQRSKNIQEGSFARSGFSVQDEEFLYLLRVSADNCADSPLKLLSLFWRIQRTHHTVIRLGRPFLDRVRKFL